MKIMFEEVEHIFESYEVWYDGREILWYEKAWLALEKAGLTAYNNILEGTVVILRVFTLIMIYMEYCELTFEESFFYEFPDWQEYSGLSAFRIGQLAARELVNQDFCEYDEFDDEEALETSFMDLVEKERYAVVDSLIKNIGEGGVSTIFVTMYLTCCDMSNDENEYFDMEEEVRTKNASKELTEYEKYENDIEQYYKMIVNDISYQNMASFSWLSEGTYRLR